MSLTSRYQGFLAEPAVAALSDNASLNYITTLTTINTAASIIKHFTAHQKALKKKQEKVLDCVEGGNAISLDVETTLEFLTGGGAYLPGLDDNFVSDRVVTFPMVSLRDTCFAWLETDKQISTQIHVVRFDSEQKIQQIRLSWDQGSLLKQIDVIGARARNWPIRDGKDQARLIASSASHTDQASNAKPSTAAPHAREQAVTGKPRTQSNNVTRDPHASLSLFASSDETKQEDQPQTVALRAAASAKPPPRDYHDLFVGNESDDSSTNTGVQGIATHKESQSMRPPPPKAQTAKPPPRDYHDLFVGNDSDNSPVAAKRMSASPQKDTTSSNFPGDKAIAPKGGAGKNYQPSRLFGADAEGSESQQSPYKPYPKKYEHFDFGDGEDGPKFQSRPNTKHQSQWDFEDFTTPVKPNKVRDQDKRRFGLEEDEHVVDNSAEHGVAKARPDADPYFEFRDDGTEVNDRRPPGHPRGAAGARNMGIYQNNIFDENAIVSPEKDSKPLAPVTNLADRRKDFDPHFEYADIPSTGDNEPSKAIPEGRVNVVRDLGANWEAADASPSQPPSNKRPEPEGTNKENMSKVGKFTQGIKSGGDGMGGKKGQIRSWGFGSDSGDEEETFRAGKKQQAPKENRLWDF